MQLRTIERLAWGVGIGLLAIYLLVSAHGALLRRSDLAEFEAARLEAGQFAVRTSMARSEPPLPPSLVGDETSPDTQKPTYLLDTSLWAEGRIEEYEESLRHEMGLPLAVLRIPKIRLAVPIREGTSELVLNRAVGHIAGTGAPGRDGNLGIAGHRDGYFRGLKDLEAGDVLEVSTLHETRTYRIDEILIVRPEDVYVLDPTPEPSVTLVTCYPFYFVGSAPKRYIVKATLAASRSSQAPAAQPTQ